MAWQAAGPRSLWVAHGSWRQHTAGSWVVHGQGSLRPRGCWTAVTRTVSRDAHEPGARLCQWPEQWRGKAYFDVRAAAVASGHPDVTVPWRLAMARVDAGHTGTVGPIPRLRLGSHKLDELVCHRCVEPAGAVALGRHDSLATRLGSCCPFLPAPPLCFSPARRHGSHLPLLCYFPSFLTATRPPPPPAPLDDVHWVGDVVWFQ